ncbi:condensation domain-containing protein, partial [Pseudomonas sp. RIT-PI-S]|uniref:condensation domain-containing protein n=1 Tax=Pseudomonas sp. RIT-PI-S TaxID=3035295 RepID=UPI0021D96766
MQNLIDSVGSLSARERKALAVMLKQKGINLYGIAPIFRREPGEPLLPSYAQQRQWFLWQLDPTSSAYHLPTALHLHGALDLPALQRALTALVARHESLRTRFEEVAGQLQVMLLEPWAPMLDVRESTGEAWQAALAEEVAQPFDLATGPLFRVAVWRLGEQEHGLSLVLHHSIADGVSLQVMVDELVGLYSACREGAGAQPPALTVQYPDYALWQRQWMDAGERERQLAYWAERLRGEPQVLALPADRPRPAQQSFAGATLQVTLDPPALTRLKAFAQGENLTLFMLLLGSFQALLQRYTGQADIRVGVPIANRHRAETEGLIGFFVNTQVLKAEVDDALGARALWRQVRQAALEAQEYQDLPFEQLVEVLQPERSLSHNPLFQVMFNHQVQGQARQLEQAGLRIEAVAWENRNAQFDLTLNTAEHPGGLEAAFTYATDLFDAATVERLAGHWQQLLQAMVNAPDTPLADLPLLSASERSQLVEGFNATAV